MAWTSKVANVIKGKVASMALNAIGNKLMSNFANSGQTSKIAAKLLNKSPLEIGNDNPTAHIKQNPYSYGTVYYPQETSNMGDGHYVIFDVLMHNESSYKTQTFNNGLLTDNSKNFVAGETNWYAGKVAGTSVRNIKNIKRRGIEQTNRVRGVNSGVFSKLGSCLVSSNCCCCCAACCCSFSTSCILLTKLSTSIPCAAASL